MICLSHALMVLTITNKIIKARDSVAFHQQSAAAEKSADDLLFLHTLPSI